jgi:hypothetical protein
MASAEGPGESWGLFIFGGLHVKHPNSPIGRRSTGPHIARKAAGHIQRNHARPGRNWLGDRAGGGQIDPTASAAPSPGSSMPMDAGSAPPPMGGGAPMPPGGDEGLGGL